MTTNIDPCVDVLLAAYNGEKYLDAQIESILRQTYPSVRLLIRDDGSSDSTPAILQRWAALYPSKVFIISSNVRKGVKGNFSDLLSYVQSPYMMFSDQDDVWIETKIAKTLAVMRGMEERYGTSCPCLVHTDLKIVDDNLSLRADSFWKFSQLNPVCGGEFSRLLMQNVVTGCTAMMNRSLSNRMGNIPSEALMHDWWVALVAAAFGKIGILSEPTVFYRQHPKNVLGAQQFGTWVHIKKSWKRMRKASGGILQAKVFYDRYHTHLDKRKKEALEAYLSFPACAWLTTRYLILRYRLFKNGCLRNMAAFFLQNFSME